MSTNNTPYFNITSDYTKFVREQTESGGARDIAQGLKKMEEDVVGKLPERLFKKYFIEFFFDPPLLTDEQIKHHTEEQIQAYVDKKAKHKYLCAEWVRIAGRAYYPVNVLDDITGAVLFTVPPLINQAVVDIHKGDKEFSYSDIIGLATLHARNSPQQARNVFQQQMHTKLVDTVNRQKGSKIKSYKDTWDMIEERYSAEIAALTGKNDHSKNAKASQDWEDDIVFDD